MASISIDRFSEELETILKDYQKEVEVELKRIVHETSSDFKKNTQRDAPRGRRKKYYKNIDVKTTTEKSNSIVDTWYVKSPEYRLTHLIKNGHQTRNGGRTKGNDFIDKNFKIAEKEMEEKIKEVVSRGY